MWKTNWTRFSEQITISDKTLVKCYISNTSNGDKIEVSTALKPVEGVNKLGSFITFELSDRFNTKSDQPKNAFDVLVNTAVTLKYPQKIGWNPEECRTLYICLN